MELSERAKNFKLGMYKHFKGTLYEVLSIARHTETGEELVIYKSLDKGIVWARPIAMWDNHVERDGYNGPRFAYVESLR